MAELVIENLGALKAQMDSTRWWAAVERAVPRALVPLARAIRLRAPRPTVRRRPGTPRLADRFDVAFVEPIHEGFVRGVQAAIIARQPYGHLVSGGHRIVPRGPARKEKMTRARRALLRTKLKERRAQGAFGVFGQVPGNPFVRDAVAATYPQVLSLLEKLIAQDLKLGVTA